MEVYSIYIVDEIKKLFGKYSKLERGIIDCKRSFIPFFLVFFLVFVSFGCNNKSKNTRYKDDSLSAIYSKQAYSNLKLDSLQVYDFIKSFPLSDSIRNGFTQFYTYRNFEYAWITKDGLALAATNFYEQLHAESKDFADNSLLNKTLDSLFNEASNNEKKFLKQANRVKQLELLLTATFFKYAEKVYGGATRSTIDLGWFIPRKKKDYLSLLNSLVSNKTETQIQEPVNEYYIRLKEKLKLYRDIKQRGGFRQIIANDKFIKLGDSATYILPIKHHLTLTGDLITNDNTMIFTQNVKTALLNFQHRMGLPENGELDAKTLNELNQTVDFRIKQIMVNLERLRWVPIQMERDYLLVNIPEFRLHVFENNKQLWQTNVVVGKTARRTSIFRGNLSTIVLNPYWGVPYRIAQEEIIPKIRRNPNYLANNNMEFIDGNYRQKPGKNNALGKIKFLFPNNYSIYLHDTPAKSLFKENFRAFSHGCIRVENPIKLANHLLKDNAGWSESRVNQILATTTNTTIKISPTVPVYIAYFTAWVDNTGKLNFRNDIYNLDIKLSKEIFGEQ